MNKKYTWCFMGQIHAQGPRKEMIESLKSIDCEYFCRTSSGWLSEDGLNTSNYKKVLAESVFVPCPRGNSCVDSFRLYEALEVGSIPIVEKDEYWKEMYGDDCPLIQVESWGHCIDFITEFKNNSNWIDEKTKELNIWWNKNKDLLKNKLGELNSFKLSNPSLLKYKNKFYGVFRGEDFVDMYEDIVSGRLGSVAALINSRASYCLKVFNESLKEESCGDFIFQYKDKTYGSYFRKQIDKLACIEDLRLIDGSIRENELGDIVALATATILDESFTRGYPPFSPCLCEINFTEKIVSFKYKMVDLLPGDENHKNWMVINDGINQSIIISMFPLFYKNFKITDELKVDRTELVNFKNIEYRNSCQPIRLTGENKWGMLCHKKNGVRYNYIWVEFKYESGSINIISKKEVNMPRSDLYCSGVFRDELSDSVYCCAGVNNFDYKIFKMEMRTNRDLAKKKEEFLKLKKDWPNFVQRDSFKYIASRIKSEEPPGEKFSVYNPGSKIGIVSLYNQAIKEYAVYSEKSIREYAIKNNYTFYVYRDTLDGSSSPNWSKAKALLNHIDDHESIVWMDSDTLIYDDNKKFEDIIDSCPLVKKIIACEDIGTNNTDMPKGSMLNSGVLIFRSEFYSKNIIQKWMDFDGDKSSLYASGGDQEILCNILKESDGFGFNRKIFPMNKFNTEPRMIDDETFIVHFMAYPFELKKIFMSYYMES